MSSYKDTILANTAGKGMIVVLGRIYDYKVVKKELDPRLPHFVGVIDGLLFISEETPIEFREYPLKHEVFCNFLLKGQPGRCLEALRRELSLVPVKLKKKYIRFRTKFFEALVKYYKESTNEEFKGEIEASLQYLRSLSS